MAQQRTRARTADRDRAAREIDENACATKRELGGRRHRDPHVLADLDADGQARNVLGREQKVGAERGMQPAERDRLAEDAGAGGEMPPLVEFAISRQVALGHDAEDVAAMDDDRAIVDAMAKAQRRADDQHGHQCRGGLDDRGKSTLDRIEQRILLDQILDRIAGQAQLGKHGNRHRLLVAVLRRRQNRPRIGRGIGHMRSGDAGRHARKSVGIDRVEAHRAKDP